MKTSTKLIAGISTLALALTVAITPAIQPNTFAAGGTEAGQGIHVNGTGKISIEPDTAILTVGVESKGESSEATQRKSTIEIKKLIDALKAKGIDKEDIKTQWFNIYPDYDYSNGERKELGFKASHTLEVKVRDLDSVTEVIEAATKAGADNVNNIQYTVENKEEAMNEARMLAIKDARAKADKLAKALNIKVGSVVNVSEYSDSGISPIYMEGRGSAMLDSKAAADNVFNPGTVEVRLDVNISYAIN